jgi:hypothetical protein
MLERGETYMKESRISPHQKVDVVEIMKKIRQNAAKNRTELSNDEKVRREAKSEFVSLLQSAQVPDVIADQIRQQAQFEVYDPRTLYYSSRRGLGSVISLIRRILRPITKLFVNVDPLAHEVHRLTVLNNLYLKTMQDLVTKTAALRVEVYSMKKRSSHRRGDDRNPRYNSHGHHGHRRYSRDRNHKREEARPSSNRMNSAEEPSS